MNSRTITRWGFAVVAVCLGAASCGRSTIDFGPIPDPDAGAGTGGLSVLDGGGGVGNSGGVSGDGGGAAIGGDGGTGGSCLSVAQNECDDCTCTECGDVWSTCADESGCLDILACADQSGCSGVDCYLGPCQAVIDQNGGPFSNATNAAQTVANCRTKLNCPCGGGTGGSGGTAGTGGTTGGGGSGGFGNFGGFGGFGGGTGGTGGGGPLACLSCITQQCPSAQDCLFDNVCRDGVICAFQSCLSGGPGGLNLQCMLQCFNGDFQAALKAFNAVQCVFGQCGQQCANGIPGLPGGGFPGGGGGGTPQP